MAGQQAFQQGSIAGQAEAGPIVGPASCKIEHGVNPIYTCFCSGK